MNCGTRARSGFTLITADGADVENITISNCTITDVQAPVFIRRQHRDRQYTSDAQMRAPAGVMRDIIISNIVAQDTTQASLILGVPGAPIENVNLHNWFVRNPGGCTTSKAELEQIDIDPKDGCYPDCDVFGELPASGLYVDYAENIRTSSLHFTNEQADTRQDIVTGKHTQ